MSNQIPLWQVSKHQSSEPNEQSSLQKKPSSTQEAPSAIDYSYLHGEVENEVLKIQTDNNESKNQSMSEAGEAQSR